jgi:hypothetical protein
LSIGAHPDDAVVIVTVAGGSGHCTGCAGARAGLMRAGSMIWSLAVSDPVPETPCPKPHATWDGPGWDLQEQILGAR